MVEDGPWQVLFHPSFKSEFREFSPQLKKDLGSVIDAVRRVGPTLARPQVDTIKGSRHANMKEMRVPSEADWYRFAFAFDPKQQAVVLCGGGKGGVSQEKFYRALIEKADRRFDEWLKETDE